jgi:hypothetical protein
MAELADNQLWLVCRKLPSDFEPYGERKWEGRRQDCSGCRWFQPLLRAGVLDWGTCANPSSPRAGLLTFSEQGCDGFEPSEEPTDDETWRSRAEFKDKVENILIEAHGQYVHLEIGKLNDPNAHDFIWLDHYESSIQRALDLLLCRLLEGEATFDRRQAAEEMIAELKQESERSWECGRVTQLRILKRRLGDQAAEGLTIRMPDIRSRDDEFWERVDAAITEALERKDG